MTLKKNLSLAFEPLFFMKFKFVDRRVYSQGFHCVFLWFHSSEQTKSAVSPPWCGSVGPALAVTLTPDVKKFREIWHGVPADNYIMAAESQKKGLCLVAWPVSIPPNKALQINVGYYSENSLQPCCTNSWKGEENQLALVVACRIIS